MYVHTSTKLKYIYWRSVLELSDCSACTQNYEATATTEVGFGCRVEVEVYYKHKHSASIKTSERDGHSFEVANEAPNETIRYSLMVLPALAWPFNGAAYVPILDSSVNSQ